MMLISRSGVASEVVGLWLRPRYYQTSDETSDRLKVSARGVLSGPAPVLGTNSGCQFRWLASSYSEQEFFLFFFLVVTRRYSM